MEVQKTNVDGLKLTTPCVPGPPAKKNVAAPPPPPAKK